MRRWRPISYALLLTVLVSAGTFYLRFMVPRHDAPDGPINDGTAFFRAAVVVGDLAWSFGLTMAAVTVLGVVWIVSRRR